MRPPKRKTPQSATWRELGDTRLRAGDAAGADLAYVEYARCAADDAELMRAGHAIVDGKTAQAEFLLRARLKKSPDDIVALRLLADILGGAGQFAAAEALLERAMQLAPSFAGARHTHAILLFRQEKSAQAIPHIERLLAADPANAGYRALLGSCFAKIGAFERAIVAYERVLQLAPREAPVWLSYGNALRHAGRAEDSVRAFRQCLAVAPAMGEAYCSLANLGRLPLGAEDVAAMRQILRSRDTAAADRAAIHYALGRVLELRGEYAESFTHYAEGARLAGAELKYDPNETTAHVARAEQFFTAELFAARAGAGATDAAPIFILGMPRAGSTLIEQILASHSAVEGTMELPEITNLARDLGQGGDSYPACLATLDDPAITALGQRYIELTRIYRKTEKPFFIDKMPANWAHIGLIRLILPNAKIIDARRDPMANGFAVFKKYFADRQPFSYSLEDIARYYNDYLKLTAHFDTVQPGCIHRVAYEQLVENTEAEIRRLLDYCGLEFEPACLRFWETKRAVSTASAEQVKRPIFREGLEEWRNYEPWLGGLKEGVLF